MIDWLFGFITGVGLGVTIASLYFGSKFRELRDGYIELRNKINGRTY